jgi:hypothetical protein
MSQLASAAGILQRPVLLAVIAIAALVAWGLVTFLAVRRAVISGSRAARSAAAHQV